MSNLTSLEKLAELQRRHEQDAALDDSDLDDSEPDEPEAVPVPELPPPPNIDLTVFKAELAALADVEIEALLKGFILESREIVRGTASLVSDPRYAGAGPDLMRCFNVAADTAIRVAETIGKLRGVSMTTEERLNRYVVERIAAPAGVRGGSAQNPKNE